MTNALTNQPANADITAILRGLGLSEPEQESSFNRAKVNGITIELGDDLFPTNQKTGEPAFYGRLLEMPDEYQGFYFDEEAAEIVDRPSIANQFCRSHYNKVKYPLEGGEYAQDGTACRQCPINPFVKKENSPLPQNRKCSWRGDVLFQRTDAEGNTLDERPWTLSLSTTGMIELKGMRSDPEKGYISPLNFMQKLARLGIEAQPDLEPAQAVGKAALALSLGGVIAGFYAIQTKNANSMSFPVIKLEPVALVEPTGPALPSGEENPAATAVRSREPKVKNVTPKEADAAVADAIAEDDLPF